MDTSARRAAAIALLAAGCGFSAASHAYGKEEDAAAQDREVQAAYDRGYKAAREEMAQQAAAAAAAPTKQPVAATTRQPILDIKHTYSDAGEVATVMTVPVIVRPLADGQIGRTEQVDEAAPEAQAEPPAPVQPGARVDGAAATSAPVAPQPNPRAYAQAPANHQPVAASAAQDDVAPPESLANDEAVDESEPPRAAQIYSTQSLQYAQPAQPRTAYAPPPVASRPPSPPYGYAQQPPDAQQQPGHAQHPAYAQQQPDYAQQSVYAQQPAYAPPRPAYYAAPARWSAQYQPQPPARWVYWSPQYGRWMYY